jgi:hypothetical protein
VRGSNFNHKLAQTLSPHLPLKRSWTLPKYTNSYVEANVTLVSHMTRKDYGSRSWSGQPTSIHDFPSQSQRMNSDSKQERKYCTQVRNARRSETASTTRKSKNTPLHKTRPPSPRSGTGLYTTGTIEPTIERYVIALSVINGLTHIPNRWIHQKWKFNHVLWWQCFGESAALLGGLVLHLYDMVKWLKLCIDTCWMSGEPLTPMLPIVVALPYTTASIWFLLLVQSCKRKSETASTIRTNKSTSLHKARPPSQGKGTGLYTTRQSNGTKTHHCIKHGPLPRGREPGFTQRGNRTNQKHEQHKLKRKRKMGRLNQPP